MNDASYGGEFATVHLSSGTETCLKFKALEEEMLMEIKVMKENWSFYFQSLLKCSLFLPFLSLNVRHFN